jgi:uncharacterized membrane protein YccC
MLWTPQEWRSFWRTELQYDEGRWKIAIKTALACAICVTLGLALRLPLYHWMLITVFVLMLPRVGASLEKSLLRVVGTLIGAVFGIWLTASLLQHPLLYVVALMAFLTACYYFAVGPTHPYAFLIASITCVMVAVDSIEAPEKVVAFGASRALEITIGILVSLAVTILVWPVYASRDFRTGLAQTASLCAGLLRDVGKALRETKPIPQSHRERESMVGRKFTPLVALLEQAAYEDHTMKEWNRELTGLILQMESVLAQLAAARRAAQEPMPEGLHVLVETEVAALVHALAARLDALAAEIRGGASGGAPDAGVIDRALADLHAALETHRALGRQHAFPSSLSARFYSIVVAFGQIAGRLREASSILDAIRNRSRHMVPASRYLPRPPFWKRFWQFDEARFRHGVKAGIALMTVFFLTQADVIPFPVPTMVSAAVVVGVTSAGAGTRKALMRLAGALSGGVLALLYVIFFFSQVESFLPMLIGTSLAYLIFAYVNAGPASYNYIGFQMGIAFVITIFGAYSPPDSIVPPLERLAGVLGGTGISLLYLHFLWPVPVIRTQRRLVTSLFRKYAAKLRSLRLDGREQANRIPDDVLLAEAVLDKTAQGLALCLEARFEDLQTDVRNAEISRAFRLAETCFFSIVSLEAALAGPQDERLVAGIKRPYEQFLGTLAGLADEIASGVESGTIPPAPSTSTAEAQVRIEKAMNAIRAGHVTTHLTAEQVTPYLTVIDRARQVDLVLAVAYEANRHAFGESAPLSSQPVMVSRPVFLS